MSYAETYFASMTLGNTYILSQRPRNPSCTNARMGYNINKRPMVPAAAAATPANGVANCCSDPISTRAGGQDGVSYTNFQRTNDGPVNTNPSSPRFTNKPSK